MSSHGGTTTARAAKAAAAPKPPRYGANGGRIGRPPKSAEEKSAKTAVFPASTPAPAKESPRAAAARLTRDYTRQKAWLDDLYARTREPIADRPETRAFQETTARLDAARTAAREAAHQRDPGVRAMQRGIVTAGNNFNRVTDVVESSLRKALAHPSNNAVRGFSEEMDRLYAKYNGMPAFTRAHLRTLTPFQRAFHDWLTGGNKGVHNYVRMLELARGSAPTATTRTRKSA